ncbi:MAG: hypothetical protein AB7R69_03555 [Candidatus Babeliales bacterium]
MKRFILGILLVGSTALKAEDINWAHKFIEFKKLSKIQKLEWLDFGKDWDAKKADMMGHHKAQWFDFGIKNIDTWNKADITTQADKNKIFEQQLKEAIALRKQHGNDWKEFYEGFDKEGNKIHQNHLEALKELEESFSQEDENDDNEDEEAIES